ncbi:DUF1016 N-terminal domain-containing protein [Prevotella sp.]|uniref:hypothetical protein n=1 Tax=Prevotella sp. TaxID=59823 RepID=UPI00307C5BF8
MMDKISTQYNQAVQLIKSAILQNQLEAAKAVNRQMLALYYGVGKYVSDNTRKGDNFTHFDSTEYKSPADGWRFGLARILFSEFHTFYCS